MKIEETLIKIFPRRYRLPIKYQYHKIRNRLEKEIFYLEQLGGTHKRAIDIGANVGIYSYALAQIYDSVEVFEPQSWCTENILFYSQTSACNISVHNVGLANFNGSLTLHVPTSLGDYSQLVRGLGSLTTGLGSFREIKGEQISIDVPVRKLDDYKFKDVSFMKIDVEGYETKVIEGARNTILTEKPIILMEVEQKHLNGKSIEDVFEQMFDLGYECSFIYKASLTPIVDFYQSIKTKQNNFLEIDSQENYINNFIFKPTS
ncbi:MAG: FkbM family methyltransferase [Nostoc sp.]|uniref:FkbM family methyltransferase n=1 Tax=Nostoc sp. TaxID=1180 RepID=UPI002FF99A4B